MMTGVVYLGMFSKKDEERFCPRTNNPFNVKFARGQTYMPHQVARVRGYGLGLVISGMQQPRSFISLSSTDLSPGLGMMLVQARLDLYETRSDLS